MSRADTQPPLPPQLVGRVRDFLEQRTGIWLAEGKEYLLTTRLSRVAEANGGVSVTDLLERVLRAPGSALAATVCAAVATHETEWFRDLWPFRFVADDVLPAWRGTAPFRAWSAGCATGEEAWSLALVLEDWRLGPGRGCEYALLGTDLAEAAVVAAGRGRYRECPAPSRWTDALWAAGFRRDGTEWAVLPDVRRRVRFATHNLALDPAPVTGADLVFCRNTLIYFRTGTRARILRALHRAMAPGGWLVLGAAESVAAWPQGFEAVRRQDGTVYRRVDRPAPDDDRGGAEAGTPRRRPDGSDERC